MNENARTIGGVTFDPDVDFASLDALIKKLKPDSKLLPPEHWIQENKILLLTKALQWGKANLIADLSHCSTPSHFIEAAILADNKPAFEKYLKDCHYLPELKRLLKLAVEKGRGSMQDRLNSKLGASGPIPHIPPTVASETLLSHGRTHEK